MGCVNSKNATVPACESKRQPSARVPVASPTGKSSLNVSIAEASLNAQDGSSAAHSDEVSELQAYPNVHEY